MSIKSIKEWLEIVATLIGIIGAVSGGIYFVISERSTSIEKAREIVARKWTNEGDISSQNTRFITLDAENYRGDIIGTLYSPKLDRPLDVSIDIGWFSSDMNIVVLKGRIIVSVAKVSLKITGNQNRLNWKVTSDNPPDYLPVETVLWELPPLK